MATFDVKEKCSGCFWLELSENCETGGTCTCPHCNITYRRRKTTDRKCTWKNRRKEDTNVKQRQEKTGTKGCKGDR